MNTELELEIEPEPTLDIEPEPESAAAPAPLAPLALAEVLDKDFPLPSLIHWVPDVRMREQLGLLVAAATAIDVTADGGLVRADSMLAEVRDQVKFITAHFAEPVDLANRMHKRLTTLRGEWTAPGSECVSLVGGRISREKARLDGIASEERRKAQEQADAEARAARIAEAKAAQTQGAPASVVEQMTQAAKVATAPPVPMVSAAPVLAHTTVIKSWKARIKGTPADAEPLPDIGALTPPQTAQVLELLRAIVEGRAPLACIQLNTTYLNNRAKAEKQALGLSGIESFEEAGVRARPGRRLS